MRLLTILLTAHAALAGTVPLQITPSTPPLPITCGVPFPPGELKSPDAVRAIDAGGHEVPAQVVQTAAYPDGSVRWLLVELPSNRAAAMEYGDGVRRGEIDAPLKVVETADAIAVDTGPLQFTVRKRGFNGLNEVRCGAHPIVAPGGQGGPYFLDERGTAYRACLDQDSDVAVELSGPLRSVITARGWFASAAGERKCRYIVRIHAFAGQPWLRVLFTWIMTESTGDLRFRDIGIALPMAVSTSSVGLGLSARTAVLPATLVQVDHDHALLNGQATSQAADGWLAAQGSAGGCAIGVRDFRHLFPKELSATAEELAFHLWPAHAPEPAPRPVTDAILPHLWFAHEGRLLDFAVPESYTSLVGEHTEYEYRYLRSAADANAMGLAKTHELSMLFTRPGEDTAAVAARLHFGFQDPPTAIPSPRWMCDSGVFGRIDPVDTATFPDDEAMISNTFDAERRMEDHNGDYGMWNYGDSHTSWDMSRGRFDDGYRVWRNTHHGAPRLPWLLYVRSGDPKYLQYAVRNTRHVADEDFCHWSTPEVEALPYPKGKIRGALNDYKGLVHWHSGNRLTDYNSMTDFLIWSWHLTGDRWPLEVALDWGEAVKSRYTKPFGHREGAGTCAALLALYDETLDPRLREIAGEIANHLLSTQREDGSFPQWEDYAPWLERWCELTGDEQAKAALVRWADAYLAGYGDSMSTYHVCGELNILSYAWHYSGDPKYLARARWLVDRFRASTYAGDNPLLQGLVQQGQVSLSGYGIQRLPLFIRAMRQYGQPVKPDMLLSARKGFALPFLRTRPVIDGKSEKIETLEAWVLAQADHPFTVTIHTTHTYDQRHYLGQVTAPDGKVIQTLDEQIPRGDKDFTFTIPADGQRGVYRISLGGFGSYGRFRSPIEVDPPLPVAFPLTGRMLSEDPSGYYLYVPASCRKVALRITPVKDAVIYGQLQPPGGERTQFSVPFGAEPVTVGEVAPEDGQTGQPWLLNLNGAQSLIEMLSEGPAVPPLLFAEAYEAGVCEAMAAAKP